MARVAGGRWLHPPDDAARPVTGVSIDTRTLRSGDAFFAVRGERFDGHDYAAAALGAGAAMAVVERAVDADGPVLLVRNTVAALQRLAAAWRDVLAASGCTVIAVAGSNGKTTTRHMIHTVLSRERLGTQSPRSFNNHLGVPLTLLAARAEHAFVVVEVGTNHPGEVAALAEIVRPDLAVITSIGEEHLEFFGSVEGVAREQATLLDYIRPGGVAFMNNNVGAVMEREAKRFPRHLIQWVTGAMPLPDHLASPGSHNRRNAALAAAVARVMGVSDEDVVESLARVEPLAGRCQHLHIGQTPGGVVVIHDAYNANPTSVAASLNMLAEIAIEAARPADEQADPVDEDEHVLPAARRVMVLGDMLELGTHAVDRHRRLGDLIVDAMHGAILSAAAPVVLVAIGELARHIAERIVELDPPEDTLRLFVYPVWSDDLPERVAELLQPGDVVLLKASRGMALERLLPAIRERFAC